MLQFRTNSIKSTEKKDSFCTETAATRIAVLGSRTTTYTAGKIFPIASEFDDNEYYAQSDYGTANQHCNAVKLIDFIRLRSRTDLPCVKGFPL